MAGGGGGGAGAGGEGTQQSFMREEVQPLTLL